MARETALPTGTVTFLFTDIEGSTKLLTRLGRGGYRETLETHNRLIRAAIARHGGAEVDRQGDAFFIAFDTAGEAVAAAVEAQRSLNRERWPGGETVAVRMGIHTGEATLGESGYIGLAVHQAARVAGAAVGGQILLSATSARLVAAESTDGVALRDLGEHALADLDHPEQLFLIEADGLESPTVMRAALPWRPAPELLERDAELAAFQALIESARAGRGRLVIIEGPAGIGKTALLTQTRRIAEAAGFDTISARSGELETRYAFGVVRQLLEPAVAAAGADGRETLMAGAAELAAPVLGWGSTEQHRSEQDSFATLHGLYWLTANLVARGPLLVVVDDLHWTDEASLEWLVYVSRRLDGLPLLLLCATRSPQQSAMPSLVTELLSDPLASVIRPTPLSARAVSSLASQRLEQQPDENFTNALLDATAGNPLYLGALLDAVATAGIEPTTEHRPELDDLAPEAVARGIALRLSRLPPEATRLVQAAAILGSTTPLTLTASLADLDEASALSASALLIRHELLARVDPPAFRHPVVRTAVYSEIDLGERSAAHKRAARVLLASGASPEQAAVHLLHTFAAGDAFVTTTLRQAATRLLAHGAPETAISYLRRALDEPAGDEVAAVLHELGSAELFVGGPGAVDSLARALDLTDDPRQRAAIALQYGRALWLSGQFDRAAEVIQEATDHPEAVAATPLREELEAGLIGVSAGHERFYPLAVERLSRVRTDRLVGGIGSDQLLALLAEFEMRRGLDRRRAVSLAEQSLESGNVVGRRDFALYSATAVLLAAGEIEQVAVAVDPALTEARREGDLVATCRLINLRSLVELHRGDLRAAERDVAEAVELADLIGLGSARWLAIGREAWVGLEAGNAEPARQLITAFEPGSTGLFAAQSMFFLELRGRLRVLERRPDAALADFLDCGRAARSIGFENPANSAWRSQAALALRSLERHKEALELAAEELELARAWGEPRAIGVSVRALGLVEGGKAGEQLLREAVEVLARAPSRLEYARALIELGAALRRANSRSEARKQLRDGLELAEQCGATALFERANDELAATGAHRRTIMLSGLDALTASERRVAELAADGASNRDIAQALFVTVKTVEMHLSRVYRKLALSSRAQLASALDRAGAQAPATG